MKTVVLASGYGYDWRKKDEKIFLQYDFGRMARNYFKNKFKGAYNCTVFNFHDGTVEYNTGQSGFKPVKEYNGRKLTPITAGSYGEYTALYGNVKSAFKKGQPGALSILDVYDYVKKQAAGSIIELSFFAHAYEEGPVLVNSYDDSLNELRDKDDKDSRYKDFNSYYFDVTKLTDFGKSFDDHATIFIKGCLVDRPARSVIEQISELLRRKFPRTAMTIIKNIAPKFKAFIDQSEDELRVGDPERSQPAGIIKLEKFGEHEERVLPMKTNINIIIYALYKSLLNTYAYKMAAATKVKTYAAIVGVGSEINESGYPPMYVPSGHQTIIDFYKSQLKIQFDKERYALYSIKENYYDQISGK